MPNRRAIILGAAGASLAAAPLRATTGDHRVDPQETANARIVADFCQAWSLLDMDKLLTFLDPKIEYQVMEGGQVLNGHDGFRKGIGGWLPTLARAQWDIHRTAAFGDMVVNERTDHFFFKDPAKPAWHLAIAGMFIVRDGRIRYWRDYNLHGAPPRQG